MPRKTGQIYYQMVVFTLKKSYYSGDYSGGGILMAGAGQQGKIKGRNQFPDLQYICSH